MARKQIAREEMLKRVARFSDLTPTDPQSFGSEMVPQGLSSYSVIGRGVVDDPALQPPIAEAQGFNTVVVKAVPGTGAPMHAHATVEVFIPLNSHWVFYWGETEEEQITLAPWDTISFPSGMMHGFRNVGTEEGSLYVILGGTDAGRVAYEKRPAQTAFAPRCPDGREQCGNLPLPVCGPCQRNGSPPDRTTRECGHDLFNTL